MNNFNRTNFNDRFGRPYLPQDMIPMTNKIYVTSLEDALNRPCDLCTEILYINQNEPVIYEVVTNINGHKTYTILDVSVRKPTEKSVPVTPQSISEYDALRKEMTDLKAFIEKKFEEVNKNEPVVQRSNVTDEPKQ